MEIIINIFGITLSKGFVTFLIAMILVLFLMLWATKVMQAEKGYRITSVTSGIIDMLFMFVYDLVKGIVGEELVEQFMPLGLSLFFTLLLANTLSLIGLQEAVTDLVVPFVLVITLFVAWTIYALKTIGFGGYIKGLFGDSVATYALSPLELLGRFTSPFSMAFRIFGNILSGFIIMNVVWFVMGMLFTIGITNGSIILIFFGVCTSIASMFLIGYFSVFSPVIQALVFTSLALSNFKALLEEE